MCQVCKRWRDGPRLAWSTRQCLRINHKKIARTSDEDLARGITRNYFVSPDAHVLTSLIVTKRIGYALTRLEISGFSLLFDSWYDISSETLCDTSIAETSIDPSIDTSIDISIADESLSLTALAQNCPNLEHLDLRQVVLSKTRISQTNKIIYLSDLKREKKTRRRLMIFICDSRLDFNKPSLLKVAKGCRKLHTLILNKCCGIYDVLVGQMFTYCTQLVHLDLASSSLINGECLETGGPTALRRLNLNGCDNVRVNLN